MNTVCQCLSHRLFYAVPDYESLPPATRKSALAAAATVSTLTCCADRTPGYHEAKDVAVIDARPIDISRAEWLHYALSLIDGSSPSPLKEHAASLNLSLRDYAAYLAVPEPLLNSWLRIGQRSGATPSLAQALNIHERGGPPYCVWLPSDLLLAERVIPIADWQVDLPSPLPELSSSIQSVPPGEVRWSRGAYQLRMFMAALTTPRPDNPLKMMQITLGAFCRLIQAPRGPVIQWMGGTATPTLMDAWRIYQVGGPPVTSWRHANSLLGLGFQSLSQEAQTLLDRTASNAQAAELELLKEQARWAVSRPVHNQARRTPDETTTLVRLWTERRLDASALLQDRAGSLERWKERWAAETDAQGKWIAPWLQKG